jgi:hypothetical protein
VSPERADDATVESAGSSSTRSLVLVGERVMLVGDDPAAVQLAQPDRQAQAIVGLGV